MRPWNRRLIFTASVHHHQHNNHSHQQCRPIFTDGPLGSAGIPWEASTAAKKQAAKDALLQFNVMVDRGIEPDAHTYTALIQTMADANHEWQAYKLFSRMLEQGIKPLPETYRALQSATKPERQGMVKDIERKVHEAVSAQPMELAAANASIKTTEAAMEMEAERAAVRRLLQQGIDDDDDDDVDNNVGNKNQDSDLTAVEDLLGGGRVSEKLVNPNILGVEEDIDDSVFLDEDQTASLLSSSPKQAAQNANKTSDTDEGKKEDESSTVTEGAATTATRGEQVINEEGGILPQFSGKLTRGGSQSIPTMNIVSPRGVWSTLNHLESMQAQKRQPLAKGEAKQKLKEFLLTTLHDEELTIFLAANRQLRHGFREEKVQRIVDNVPKEKIEEMITRRRHYFRSVGMLLEGHMDSLAEEGIEWDAVRSSMTMDPTATPANGPHLHYHQRSSATAATSLQSESSPVLQSSLPPMQSAVHNKKDVTPQDNAYERLETDEHERLELSEEEIQKEESKLNWQAGPTRLQTPWGEISRPVHYDAIMSMASVTSSKKKQSSPRADLVKQLHQNLEEEKNNGATEVISSSAAAASAVVVAPDSIDEDQMTTTLSPSDLLHVYECAKRNEMDQIPAKNVEKYLRQFDLRYKRKQMSAAELNKLVAWHVQQFPPDGSPAKGPTRTIDGPQAIEHDGTKRTMESFEALMVIAKNCTNMQVIDSAEVNRKVAYRERKRVAALRQIAERERRQKHLAAAAASEKSKYEFFPPQQAALNALELERLRSGDHGVLGVRSVPPSLDITAPLPSQELPPWEFRKDPDVDLHILSGTNQRGPLDEGSKSGDVRIEEQFNGKFKLVSNRGSGASAYPLTSAFGNAADSAQRYQGRFHFNKEFLGRRAQEMVDQALEKEMEISAQERQQLDDQQEKQRHWKFLKFRKFLAKQQDAAEKKKEQQQQQDGSVAGPMKPRVRMASLLRANAFDPTPVMQKKENEW